jgi:hypothetical protein
VRCERLFDDEKYQAICLPNLVEQFKHLFADAAYDRPMLMDKAAMLDFIVEVVRRLDDQNGFGPLRRRWVAERSFWLDNALAPSGPGL